MEIVVKNVSKKFKKVTILENINMKFESGKIYGIVGRNGSGKSVFLKILCSFYKPTTGEVLFDNVNYSSNNSFPKSTRALIEKPTFFPDLTGFENLKLLASIQNKIGDDEINSTLEMVNLSNDKDKKYSEYSLGTKQKLAIAQVLMENTDVMIFDELFNGIEDNTVDKIRNILLELKNQNKIIIVTSHMKEDIDILADEVYKFNNGNVERIK
ncbi:MAG: ATP-binding cassette domain-containing protein [Tenericutes bacterium]|nr:ATP-binding cassette domain-containing protein [Mycoplasmatota bacterium]